MQPRLNLFSQNRIRAILICFVILSGTPLTGLADVIWVDWHTVLQNGDVEGTATVQGGTVTVTYSGERSFVQTSCGTNYWNPSAPYISVTVPNAPPDCDIIALSQATSKTLTFSEPVANVFFAVVSLNGNGYRFDRDFDILSFGLGYWGNGTLTKQVNLPTYDLIGSGEPHGVIQLLGNFTDVSWTSLSNENWNGFTIGFEETVANLAYSVGGTVSGLTGIGLALQNNGADTLPVAADGPFTFLTELGDTTAYAVTVSTQPTGQTCTVTNGSGTIAAADVTDVDVACVDDVVVVPPTPVIPIPTLSQWALIMLSMFLGLMVFANRRRLF